MLFQDSDQLCMKHLNFQFSHIRISNDHLILIMIFLYDLREGLLEFHNYLPSSITRIKMFIQNLVKVFLHQCHKPGMIWQKETYLSFLIRFVAKVCSPSTTTFIKLKLIMIPSNDLNEFTSTMDTQQNKHTLPQHRLWS